MRCEIIINDTVGDSSKSDNNIVELYLKTD